jgi:uncharacterized membrane protein
MTRITKTISVKCDSKKIIDYISNVENHPAFLSALKSIKNLSGDSHQIGSSWVWTFVMAGVEIEGEAETVEYVEGQRYAFKTTSGAESTFTYSAEPEGDGSRLTMDVNYQMPETVLAKAVDGAVVERLNDAEAERAAENLKAILEA